jgi:hypothetical protein
VYPLLLALILVLPFESVRPLFQVGSIGVTSVELPLYAVLAWAATRRDVWAAHRLSAIPLAALAWSLAHVVSAAGASLHATDTLRFALRASAGALLVFPVAALARDPARAAGIALALMAGALASAGLALAEALLPGAEGLLAPFKTAPVHVGGVLRASGPFQYPNPAALYWGATLPLVAWLAATRSIPGSLTVPRPLAVGSALLLSLAMALTGSRGGLAASGLSIGLLAVGPARPLRRPALGALAALVFGTAAVAVVRPGLIVRDAGLGEAAWYVGRFQPIDLPAEIPAGHETVIRVRATNSGALAWEAGGPLTTIVALEWRHPDGRVDHEEVGTPVSDPVVPGASAVIDVKLTAPADPGRYTLHGLLAGGGTSFADPSRESAGAAVTVVGPPAPPRAWPEPRPRQRQAVRAELWRAGLRLFSANPLLGVGPDNFRRLYAVELGPRRLDDRVNANSLYVETLAGLGLAGIAALALLFAALARALVQGLRHAPTGLLAAGSGSALAAFALHGLVDSVLHATSLFGLFWVHAGLLAGLSRPEPPPGGSRDALRDQSSAIGGC